MYKLKQLPEDFVVQEISSIIPKSAGEYLYFKLTKKDWNTLDAVKEIAKILRIREKEIGFAGSKDKSAVTEQIISFSSSSKINTEKIANLKVKDIHLDFFGQGDVPISLGDLQGNKFKIVVRKLDGSRLSNLKTLFERKNNPIYIPNYFDEQRFSENNVKIGKYILLKDFKEAVKLVDNPRCQEHLALKPNDAVGALKLVPSRLLRMYVNSFQSYLWNETLKLYLEQKDDASKKKVLQKEVLQKEVLKKVDYSLSYFVFVKNAEGFKEEKIPLIGFNEERVSEEFKLIIKSLMEKEKISHSDFIIKQIPELSLEGEFRKAVIEVTDLHLSAFEKDELNSGMQKVTLEFSLPKGSYATIVVKALF